MVVEPKVLDLLKHDSAILEIDALEVLAKAGQLNAYRHAGFWQCMDTVRDKNHLETMWTQNKAPWKIWS
jgi:glucose-1-phosphate cytidylyltransferase